MRPADPQKEAAIRQAALNIIATEGLENLSMQHLAHAAGVSPRTIYIKYENKEDMLVRLFIDVVLREYEAAVLNGFDEAAEFERGIETIWANAFRYLSTHEPQFRLLMYSKSSPLLVAAFTKAQISEGQYFKPIAAFLNKHVKRGYIRRLPYEVARALLFAPLFDLMNEHFEFKSRPKQLITEKLIRNTSAAAAAALRA
jgi:TetR/AcrR family transcriptional repressor of multidrug resistance operon